LNRIYQSIILGIVDGLTELFLSVQSTAHLRVTEALMKIPRTTLLEHVHHRDPVGAILALVLLFLSRIVDFMRTFPTAKMGNATG